jgi:predicted DNA-binding protein (MmcQ/YjbR family)
MVRLALEMAVESLASKAQPKRRSNRSRKGDSKSASRPRFTKSAANRIQNQVVKTVRALPEAEATIVSGDHIRLEVRGKRFGWFLVNHHGDGRIALNVKAAPGLNKSLTQRYPDRYHLPKYTNHHGWIGLWLDGPIVDWEEVSSLIAAAYRLAAPKSLQ